MTNLRAGGRERGSRGAEEWRSRGVGNQMRPVTLTLDSRSAGVGSALAGCWITLDTTLAIVGGWSNMLA
jgi:hypothetical protein